MNIPGYRIEREIGYGGMATVYLAEQESLGRWMALKVMAPALTANPDFTQRFLKEARTVAQLAHAHIVKVYDVGVQDDAHYLALEYVGGGDLKTLLRSGKLAPKRALAIAREVAAALGYAHGKGFVHRDVKPENVLFRDDGTAVLTDFGIAKALGSGTRMTAVGMSIGTPHYMSPEQARGQAVDHRADLYALGVVLYEMLTGRVPFDAEDTFAVAYAHVNEPPPRLPEELSRYQLLLDRLLAKRSEERFADVGELVAFIDKVFETLAAESSVREWGGRPSVDGATSRTVTMGRASPAAVETVVIPVADESYTVRNACGEAAESPQDARLHAVASDERWDSGKPSNARSIVNIVAGGVFALIAFGAAFWFYSHGMHLEERWVSAVNLNVREGPSRSARVVGRVHMGDSVRMWEAVDDWVRIGRGRWVSATFVRHPGSFRMVRGEMMMDTGTRALPIEIELGNPLRHDAQIHGRYRYTEHGPGWLTLTGSLSGDTLILDEYDASNENTGQFGFEGSCVDVLRAGSRLSGSICALQGFWRSPAGRDIHRVTMRSGPHQVLE